MARERVDLRHEQQTMLMTLYLRALDAESAAPILGDRLAVDLLDRIDYDVAPLRQMRGNLPLIVGRARLIDTQVRLFLARHPDAVVVHLGCGLDSRARRIDPPPSVTWIEVDQAPVIELRRRLYGDDGRVTTVAASVSDAGWWEQVPAGRPQLVVGEGLLMYLAPADITAVVRHLLGRDAPERTLVVDTVSSGVRRIAGLHPAMASMGTGFRSSTGDLEQALTGTDLRRTERTSLVATAGMHATGVLAAAIKLLDVLPAGDHAMVLDAWSAGGVGQ